MSYEDLEKARVARAERDAKATASKGKRGRKSKNTGPELEPQSEPQSEPKAVSKNKVVRMKRVLEPVKAPEPWRAPVARMY